MTYAETIDGPLGPTTGSPLGERVCWQITTGSLKGPRIDAQLANPGTDWMRMGSDGLRRPDLRAALQTDDGELILFSYDLGMIRSDEAFLDALATGSATGFDDQYMRIAPRFQVASGRYAWLQESLFIGAGRLTGPRAIEYEIFAVR
jgi:hypothetical protein